MLDPILFVCSCRFVVSHFSQTPTNSVLGDPLPSHPPPVYPLDFHRIRVTTPSVLITSTHYCSLALVMTEDGKTTDVVYSTTGVRTA